MLSQFREVLYVFSTIYSCSDGMIVVSVLSAWKIQSLREHLI